MAFVEIKSVLLRTALQMEFNQNKIKIKQVACRTGFVASKRLFRGVFLRFYVGSIFSPFMKNFNACSTRSVFTLVLA